MLASYPASILNHILHPSGIPFDSFKDGNALVSRIDRLEQYVKWGNLRPVDLKTLTGDALWKKYWEHLREVEKALAAAQATALEVNAAIRSAQEAPSD